ncbi:MAG: HlyD family efflux transporter periplasmic adaptor subunit [Aquificota bacterium]|nr:MAG: HlyD family efflux transporter periplasmic adaptor subunit [Aquificota bacterium]
MNIIKKYWVGFVALFLVVLATFFIYKKLNPKELPPNLVMGTGRIDGDLININTKYPGRIKKLYVDEGDKIKKGQLIAEIKSDEYEAKLKAIEETINAKQKEISAKEIELKILQESLPENVKKAKQALKASEAVLSELKENINALEKVIAQDKRDYKRFKKLSKKDLFPKEKLEKIKLKLDTDLDKLKALKQKEKQIIAKINSAKSTLNQAKATLQKIKALEKGIEALKTSTKALNAQKEEVKIILSELKIKSPIDGYVVDKVANEGEVIGAGMTVVTAIDPKELYLKMYVDTIQNGKTKIGDKAVIFLDAYPDKPIPATVVKIAKKAEFTPKEVAVREDRIQRVYAVHLKPDKPNPLLKLGIPAIGVITLDGKGLPKSLEELPKL